MPPFRGGEGCSNHDEVHDNDEDEYYFSKT
jgi:hypothetical protein